MAGCTGRKGRRRDLSCGLPASLNDFGLLTFVFLAVDLLLDLHKR